MHSHIFQITERQLTEDEYITANSFETTDLGELGVDYFKDTDDHKREDLLEMLDQTLEGIFYREGNTLTFVGLTAFIDEWIARIKKEANELNMDNIKDYSTLNRFENILKYTHLNVRSHIYCDADRETWVDTFSNFIRSLWSRNVKPGTKFYIGGIVDFYF